MYCCEYLEKFITDNYGLVRIKRHDGNKHISLNYFIFEDVRKWLTLNYCPFCGKDLVKIMKNIKTVAVSGYFDPFHTGHLKMFQRARELGDRLVVILNSDKQMEIKGKPRLLDENTRALILSNLRMVDEVVIAVDSDGTVCRTLELICPDVFANGGDRKNENDIPEAEVCKNIGCEMIFNIGGGKSDNSSGILFDFIKRAENYKEYFQKKGYK